jgi:3-oxoacyl-[acyl-carrier protein] reductase
MRLVDKRAVVTGGARGIGRAIAERLAAEGARVAILDLKRDAAESPLASKDSKHLGLACDVTDSASVDEAFESVAARFGGVDILVNNAMLGYIAGDGSEQSTAGRKERAAQIARGEAPTAHPDRIIHMTDTSWTTPLDVNINGYFFCARAAVRDMVKRNAAGSIINISSTGAVSGDGPLHYITSKAAQVGLTRGLAYELATRGIRVNAVLPGGTRTEAFLSMPVEHQRALESRTPIGRAAEPAEVAATVAFLASDDASYMTGASLAVNGAYYFW